jgi:hypothetical protein
MMAVIATKGVKRDQYQEEGCVGKCVAPVAVNHFQRE